jgi:hypothetical protein
MISKKAINWRSDKKIKFLLGVTIAVMISLAVGYKIGRVFASNPAMAEMTYNGFLTDSNGEPLTGSKNIELKLWDAESGGTLQCSLGPQPQTLTTGAFKVVLPEDCTTAVRSKSELWIEVFIDGTLLSRSKIGSVPYAIEANHAANATSAQIASSSTGSLEQRIAALESRKKVHSGRARFASGNCLKADQPCVINISAADFRSAPHCVITTTNGDGTGYTEHMVIHSITETSLNIWRGQYQPNGTTMVVEYICAER